MAAAADTSQDNPSIMREVISHQLGPMPQLLNGLETHCAALAPSAGAGGGGAGSVQTSSLPSLKRPKDDDDDEEGPPGKKIAREGGIGAGGGTGVNTPGGMSPLGSNANNDGVGGNRSQDVGGAVGGGGPLTATNSSPSGSENGGGASLSPAAAAPPASNLLARSRSVDFRHGGAEDLMALLQARVGRFFVLEGEYGTVRSVPLTSNDAVPTPVSAVDGTTGSDGNAGGYKLVLQAADPTKGAQAGGGDAAVGNGSSSEATNGKYQRVLTRLKATRSGYFVVNVQFDVAGNAYLPIDVNVVPLNESGEESSGNGGITDAGDDGRGFMQAMDGPKPWRPKQRTVYSRVTSHAFQVGSSQERGK